MRSPKIVVAVIAIATGLVLASCTSSGDPSASSTSPSGGDSTNAVAKPADQLYVSVGDSYAAGYQATGRRQGSTTRNGFAYQVVDQAKSKGYRYTLTNFACAGATTASVLKQAGCRPELLGPGAPKYPGNTQADAAENFLRAHRGKVGLITVSIGGNDITACTDTTDATSCVARVLSKVKTNLAVLLKGLRAAAGPSTRIVGITYPDVFLGGLLTKDQDARNLADLSVLAFQSFVNPALQASYRAVGGAFADVTKATGAYGSLDRTTTLPPYGKIPVPVAQICRYTYYCEFRDIHPRTNGYALISRLIVGTLPKR